jgi:hypothetical protein
MNGPETPQPNQPRPDGADITDRLIKQYIEDRESLSPDELDQLIDVLRAQPKLAVEVRTQLLIDDLLAQKLAVDRRNFLAQVGQRIGDFEQGEEEIYNQVAELRALAEAELIEARNRRSNPWTMVAMTGLAAVLAVVAFLSPQYWPVAPRAIATVQELSGDVVAIRGGQREPIQLGETISTGTPFEVARGGMVRLQYADKTTVLFTSDARFEFIANRKSLAKHVRMQRGEVLANVQPQGSVGPMVFETPQARATVLGTEFRLIVTPEATRLDVTQGQVDFVQTRGGTRSLVAANQSAVANDQGLVLRNLRWPDSSSRLVFSLHSEERAPIYRSPEREGKFFAEDFVKRGPVQFVEGVNVYNLNGGSFVSESGGEDLVKNIQKHGAFTIEAIVMPDSILANEARILSLGDDARQADFHIVQNGSKLIFRLWTNASAPTDDSPGKPYELMLGSVKPDRAAHVTITYDGTTLTGYLNGVQQGTVEGIQPGLAVWNTGAFCLGADARGQNVWRGTICDLAISDHALDPLEVARSVGQYQALFARRDAGLSWDNLMADDPDPSRFEGKGNWDLADDGWENHSTDEAWFSLGPDGLKNYDLLVDVKLVEGEGPLEMAIPIAERPVKVILGRSGSEQKNSLQDMVGTPMSGSVSINNERALPVGRVARLEVQVRAYQDEASLAVSFDGEPLVDWKGSLTDLPAAKSHFIPVASTRPVLVAAGNKVRIEALKVRDLSRLGTISQ